MCLAALCHGSAVPVATFLTDSVDALAQPVGNAIHISTLAQSRAELGTVSEAIGAVLRAVATGPGLAAALVAAVFAACCLLWSRGLLLAGALQIYILTLSFGNQRWFDNTLIEPLGTLRSHGRSIAFALLVLMLLKSSLASRGWRPRLVPAACWVFLLFQGYYLLRLGLNEPLRGALGFASVAMTWASFVLGVGKSLQHDPDVDAAVRMVAWASFAFIASNIAQLSLSYGTSVASNRFVGVSGNAQLTGYICAVFLLANMYLFVRAPLIGPTRLLYGAAVGTLALMLLWTGSRTGVLSGLVGFMMFNRAQVGRILVLGALAGLVVLGLSFVFTESFIGINRLIEGENTRREVWALALDEFAAAPLFGVIGQRDDTVSAVESSLFSTLSLLGLSGGLPLLLFVCMYGALLLRVWSLRRQGRTLPLAADLCMAWGAVLLVASVFEGFLLGIQAFAITMLYLNLAITAYLVDDAEHPADPGEEWAEHREVSEDLADTAEVELADQAPDDRGVPQT